MIFEVFILEDTSMIRALISCSLVEDLVDADAHVLILFSQGVEALVRVH